MRKLFLFGMFFISCLQLIIGQNEEGHHGSEHESEEGISITIGTGIEYSDELNGIGNNIRAYYNIGEHICFGPEYSYFKKDEVELFDFNLVGHYIFELPFGGFYPLLGANYSIEKEEGPIEEERETAFGVVFGGGFHKTFKNVTVFIEYSRVESDLADNFGTFGIMYTFKK